MADDPKESEVSEKEIEAAKEDEKEKVRGLISNTSKLASAYPRVLVIYYLIPVITYVLFNRVCSIVMQDTSSTKSPSPNPPGSAKKSVSGSKPGSAKSVASGRVGSGKSKGSQRGSISGSARSISPKGTPKGKGKGRFILYGALVHRLTYTNTLLAYT